MPKTAPAPTPATPLTTQVVGSRVIVYQVIGSTNDRALAIGGDGTVIVANAQTAGRGRHGRSWHSIPGKGLYFSVAFDKPVEGLAFAAPLAVRDALAPYCEPRVKWPNDILLNDLKCCGVLIETRQGRTALGIGINVSHTEEDFPPELRGRVTSLELATGRCFDRGELLRDVLTHLDHRVMVIRSGGADDVFAEWAAACGLVRRRVRSGGVEGIVNAIDRDGGLLLATEHGAARVVFGEIVELED